MDSIFSSTPISVELTNRLQAMPKVELHVHLEGATDAATVWELAQRNQVRLPADSLEAWQQAYQFRDFNHFIDIYLLAAQSMVTPEDFLFMIERFASRLAQQNIRYCETFLSASLMLDKFPQDEILAVLGEGMRRAKEIARVTLRFIPDISRHEPDSRYRVLDFVLRGKEQAVFIGLGLGGKEVGFPPEMFTDVYNEARCQGLRVVAHAGETEGPASIWGAIHSLKAERIGHGVRAVEDPHLVEFLRQRQIPLEVCPGSNYCLKVVPVDQPHPIRTLVDHGVYVTLNSDDPSMFSTDLNREYLLLARQGFTWDELWEINRNTLEASFLPEEEKDHYRAEWQAFTLVN